MQKQKTYQTMCDMGSIKIHNEGMSAFFDNGVGDVDTIVKIEPKATSKQKGEYLGHFTVKKKAYLSGYDCDDSKLYTFGKGRYFVYRPKLAELVIQKVDEDVHA